MKISTRAIGSVFAMVLGFAAASGHAQTAVAVSNNGTLTSSVGLLSTDAGVYVNDLTLLPASATTGFNFSGATGSNTALGAPSAGGSYYSDYLISVSPGTAESVTTTLTNSSGVGTLNERIYQVPTSGNTFLGDAAVPAGLIQAWSTNYVVPGASVSYVAPVDLTSAGLYVVEIKGSSIGSFAGTLSISAVPEASSSALLLCGLMLVGIAVYRRRA
jgi:hypothetical protein